MMVKQSQNDTSDLICPPSIQDRDNKRDNNLIPSLDIPADRELLAQGWERRFMADPIREKEVTDLYSELGFEVLSEPVKSSELSEVCGDCRLVACKEFTTIYTRKSIT